ncbi:efflux RND transporter periplasmic adaptor subunit [Pararhodobacter sp.]
MRVVPLITATLVLVGLYLFVMERDLVMEFAGVDRATAQTAEPEAAAAEEGEAPFTVVVQRFVEQDLESVIVLRGRSAASRQVEVRAETTGVVISEPRQRGTLVAAGDVLCELDPGTRAASLAEAEARVIEAQANFDAAQTAYDTARRLSAEGYGAPNAVTSAEAALQSARAGIEAARAGVEAARAELDRLTITAPFAGLLEANSAETGSLLSAGGLCATVIQLDPILIVGYAAEAQIDRLSLGAPAGVRLSNGTEVVGRVTFLARTADAATRTFRVEVTVPNPDLAIRDGMSADIAIVAQATRGHLVPGSALTLDDEGTLGLRLVDAENRTLFNPVTVLRDAPEGVWVAGLPTEADVIVVGQEYVTDGVVVRVARRGEE